MMKGIFSRVVAISMVLIVLILGLNGWLTMVSLKKSYGDSVAANYAVAGAEARRVIEYAVRYGKPLENFYGMGEILENTQSFAKDVDDVRILDKEGAVLYSLQPDAKGRELSGKLKVQMEGSIHLQEKSFQLAVDGEMYHLFMPLRNRDGGWIGTLDMVFPVQVVDKGIASFQARMYQTIAGLAIGAALLLFFFLRFFSMVDEKGSLRRKRIMLIFTGVLVITQVIFGFVSNTAFKTVYFELVRKNTAITAEIIADDIERVVGRGVPYARLSGMDEWLTKVVQSVPELEGILIEDGQRKTLYRTLTYEQKQTPLSAYQYEKELVADSGGTLYKLRLVLSETYLNKQAQELLLDIVTVAFISFFFMVEILIFALLFLQMHGQKEQGEAQRIQVQTAVIRPLAFLFFLGTDLSISFIPMQMKLLYQSAGSGSTAAVLGLPISVEMLCAGLMTLVTGAMIDKKGWRFPFFIGLGVVGLGAALSGLAWHYLVFVIARGIVGIGYGLVWMAMRGYVALLPDSAARANGFSGLSAGIYAGNICACSMGAMLATRIGYSGVFFITVAIAAAVAGFALLSTQNSVAVVRQEEAVAGERNWQRFFCDSKVLGLVLLITIPSAMCLTGFLNYFFPLYSNSLGLSTANVGRAFMIYGVSIVYLGPIFSRYMARKGNFAQMLPIASSFGVLALLVFYFKGGVVGALVGIFLFGIADSFGFVAQNTFLLSLPATFSLGQGKALGLFSMTKKLGQTLGPMMVAWGVGFGATQEGIGAIGGLYFFTILLFFFLILQRYQKGVAQK